MAAPGEAMTIATPTPTPTPASGASPEPSPAPAPPPPGPGEAERRAGQALAALALGLAAAAMAFGVARAAGGADVVAVLLPPLVFLAGGVAAIAGLSPGLAVLPLCLIFQQLGLMHVGAGALSVTVLAATLPAMLGALAARWLASRSDRHLSARPAGDRPRLALVAAVAAAAVPVAVATAVTLDWPDRGLTALFAIVGLVVSTLVGVLVLAAGAGTAGEPMPEARPRPTRLERFDWRISLLIGVVGGYSMGHVPFGPAELLLVYLVMRGFPPGFAAGAALAVGVAAAVAVLPFELARHSIDFPLAFAIVPAAFSGSVAAGWWMRRASALIGANALALLAVATNLGIIILALR